MAKNKVVSPEKVAQNRQGLADLMSMAGGVPRPVPAEQSRTPEVAEESGGASLGALPDGASVRATDRLGIRIQSSLKKRFEAVAKARGLTMSELVVELIRRAVEAGESDKR